MSSEMWFRKTIYILVVCKSIHSVPVDPYLTPMKPTLPYAFEETHNTQDPEHQSIPSPKLGKIGSSSTGIDYFGPSHPQVFENEVDFDTKYEKNEFRNQWQTKNAENKDKEEFIRFLRSILWEADEEDTIKNNQIQSRQLHSNYLATGGAYYGNQYGVPHKQAALLRWQGVLGRPMPQILKKKGLAAQAYRGFEDTCYKLACTLGINKLISQLGQMFG